MASTEPSLTVAEEYLVMISKGTMHLSAAAALCAARIQEGGADGNTEAIARMSSGRAEDWLHQWADAQSWRAALPDPYGFTAPLWRESKDVYDMAYCLLPHEMFANIYSACPSVFAEIFGKPAELAEFWTEMARTAQEAGVNHRAREHRRWLQHHPTAWAESQNRVPLGMHGDGGQMSSGEKVTVVSWGASVARAPPWIHACSSPW